MSVTRREFVWTAGAAAAALAFQRGQDIFWTPPQLPDAGWDPGIESRLTSTCLLCPARCGLQGRTVDGRLVRIAGNRLHPMSKGGVCARGVAGVQMLYHPERIATPLQRIGPRGSGQWEAVEPEAALTLLADRLAALRDAGRPEGLALLAGYCAGTMQDLWRQFLATYGSPNYIADDYPDGTEQIAALMHGIPRRPAYDLEQSDLILSFGAPLFESWWSPVQAFAGFARPGDESGERPRLIQVDTRFSKTAARAHTWVGVRPQTHAVLALGIAYVLIRDQLYDVDFVARHVNGFEDFRDASGRLHEGYLSRVVRHYRPEEVSASTGVPIETITSLARALAASRRSVVIAGSDVMLSPNGLLAGLAVHSLNVLMGRINRPGGIAFGDDPPLAPVGPSRHVRLPRIGTMPPFGPGDPALEFATAVGRGEGPAVEALLLYYANPLASSTHPERWRDALDRIPFVVSLSPFMDETTQHVDLVLPDLLPYERWQDAPAPASYPYPVWGVTQPLVEPPPGGIHTGNAMLAVAARLGGAVAAGLPYEDFTVLLKARARGLFEARRGMILGDEFERTHHRQMEERGWWLPEHEEFEPFWDDLVQRGGWTDLLRDYTDPDRLAQTPSGKVELLPAELLRALAVDGGGRQPYVDVAGLPLEGDDAFPLRLLPYRVSTLASGTLALEPWLAEQPDILQHVPWVPWVEVHPDTARSFGLDDGTLVWVSSARGRYQARCKHYRGTAPGHVNAPYGLRHPDGALASPLQLLDGSADPLTGLLSWSSTFVRLERA
ncbi:MAG: molybdopterin-dependent oxidoreductase [Gemmatimonadetes bacterium]|nr:molybdopterin-dependent oxidoreductase [Gemmatimonadota bacterium]